MCLGKCQKYSLHLGEISKNPIFFHKRAPIGVENRKYFSAEKCTGITIKGKKGVVLKTNVSGHARGSEDAETTLAPGSPGDKDKESESWDTKDGRM